MGPKPRLDRAEGYTLDAAMIARPGNMDIQLDLFHDYCEHVKLYPTFQEYSGNEAAVLAIWGNTIRFHSARREAYGGTTQTRPFISGNRPFCTRNTRRGSGLRYAQLFSKNASRKRVDRLSKPWKTSMSM